MKDLYPPPGRPSSPPAWEDVERLALHYPPAQAAVTLVQRGDLTREQALIAMAYALADVVSRLSRAEVDRLRRQPGTDDARDALRYRWLANTLSQAIAGGVEVNDQALVYEPVPEGEAVRIYWYPDTPVGSCEVKAPTLNEAIDKAIAGESAELDAER